MSVETANELADKTSKRIVNLGSLGAGNLIAVEIREAGVSVSGRDGKPLHDARGRFTYATRFIGKVAELAGDIDGDIGVNLITRATTDRKYSGRIPDTPGFVKLPADERVELISRRD